MRLMKFVPPILTLGLISLMVPAKAQVAASYQAHGLPLSIGAGPSSWDVDWGHGRMYGATAWADWNPGFIPARLNGLGLEFEVRDISHGQTLPAQKNIRQDTAEVGAIYNWRHFRNFQPYFKFMGGYGSYDFTSSSPTYSHDTRALYAPGGGVEYRVYGPLWARVDYEYQIWQTLLGKVPNPQGFTVGVAYSFSPRVR